MRAENWRNFYESGCDEAYLGTKHAIKPEQKICVDTTLNWHGGNINRVSHPGVR